MENLLLNDVIRAAHLVSLAVGMGTASYFDIRSAVKLKQVFSVSDMDELHRIHWVVTWACLGLWVTGCALIALRTGFDISAFSPKLWAKLCVVTLLTLNAIVVARFVIPNFKAAIGRPIILLPLRTLVPMTVCAGISASSWGLALLLGSSGILRVAGWHVILPCLALGYGIGLLSALGFMFLGRYRIHRSAS